MKNLYGEKVDKLYICYVYVLNMIYKYYGKEVLNNEWNVNNY